MFKKILLLLLSAWALLSLWADLSFAVEADSTFWNNQTIDTKLIWSSWNFYQTLQDWIGYFISFLYFIAVVFWLWGWFNILTSSWDEEKVKKWKNVIIYAVIWIVIIFLASSIVSFVFDSVNKNSNNSIETTAPVQ